MNKPLLSICIPTYNRVEYLIKCIDSIICQKEFINKQVEIVISDNASIDNTFNEIEKYIKKYDNIYYYRNNVNINNDNFPLVLSKGNGILRRLCNDTLCFKEDSLQYMCQIVKKYEKTKPFICWTENDKISEIEELNFEDGMSKASYGITSIASFSIWEDECVGLENDVKGTELLLWQVRKTLQLVNLKNRMVLINKNTSFVQYVPDKNISYGLFHVFYENYFKLLNPYFENGVLSKETKEFLEKDLLINFFPVWCAKWKLQNTKLQYSKSEDLNMCIYQKYHNKSYWNEYQKKYKYIYFKLKIKDIIKTFLGRN
jgi:abequosyltransferase